MSKDLEIIKQLEQTIGKKLPKLDKIDWWNSVGYVQNQQNQITGLCLCKCELKELPPEIVNLQNLTVLDLGDNQLSSLPPEIVNLQNLTVLSLGGNQLSSLPAEIVKMQNLTVLSLGQNQLSSLPPEIGELQNLTKLSLIFNQLSSLPPEIGELQNLTVLELVINQLSSLPAEIVKLQNLTVLGLGVNQLSSLPAEIVKLQHLTALKLYNNQLSSLPPEIGNLQNLTELKLYNNQLSSLPPEIGELQNLTWLYLSYNQLSSLPPEIRELQKLQKIELSNNKLTQFPKALLDLNLEVKWDTDKYGICIKNNPFQNPPIEIVKQGRQAIIDYYTALEEQSRPLNESKLIFIGDGAAGKTSLMKRLLGQEFNPQESQTHGININTLEMKDNNNNDIKLHCWDFGGQQIMHATHQFFLSKRCLYLLVIDSRRETSVDYWLKHAQTFGKDSPVIIVINKSDENLHFHLSPRKLKPNFPNLKGIQRVSCTTKKGISELKTKIQNSLADIELINTKFPEKWFKVKTALAEKAQQVNFTSFESYVDICQKNGINQETEQNTLINFLHDLGIINHFQDKWLRETNVINPQWLTEAVYTIINAPKLVNNGKLHREDLQKLLNQEIYPERKHDYILELMKKFEICYAIDENQYLLPDLFPISEPDFEFETNNSLRFILEYDFLPKSIFTRFIIRMHREIVNKTYWRTGVLLKDSMSQTFALIETKHKSLILEINGEKKREYLAILSFALTDIQSNFNNLKVTEKIGLPDNPELSVNHNHLLKLAKNGQSEYYPENSDKSYKINELLGIVEVKSETEVMQMLQKIVRMLQAQGFQEEKDLFDHLDEVVKVNPSFCGISVDVNKALKKLLKKS